MNNENRRDSTAFSHASEVRLILTCLFIRRTSCEPQSNNISASVEVLLNSAECKVEHKGQTLNLQSALNSGTVLRFHLARMQKAGKAVLPN